jgi:predicted acyl esterase
MRAPTVARVPVVVTLLLTISPSAADEPARAVDLGPVVEKHVLVPMRDGTKLSTYLYFPEGPGPWPVIYEQRYADLRGVETRQAFARLAKAGFVVAAQNFRGTHLSEGTWVGYRALGWGEQQDGYDTVEWLAKQRWSTGKIGSFGSSQGGFAQNFLAVARPPHLVCQYMIDTGLSLFHEGYRIGGIPRPERFQAMEAVCRNPEDNRRLLREWFAHPTYDDYWAAEDCTRHFDRMNVPCFTVGSWYDFMCVGSVESYVGRQHRGGVHSRGQQQLLLGPWLHGRFKDANKVGDLVYPEEAKFALERHTVRWFDHYLKGQDNGVERDPVVRYYVMGAVGEKGAPGNEWRSARDWPLPARTTAYYLQDGGKLGATVPTAAESGTTFAADPNRPATVPGRAFPCATDARPFEKHPDVRTFTTDVLAEPVEWTGKVRSELWVSSTAKDTDFIVRLSDVYPDGRSILLMDSIRRARYREGFEKEVLMEPGKIYKVAFDVGWVSQVFNKGHRIRVTLCSTAAPFYEPNPNTGEPLTIEAPKKIVEAKNTVFHNREHASRLLAPVMPPGPEKPVRVADVSDGHVHPALCVTRKGTLLAVFNKSGGGGKELLLCRSTDDGKTWSKPEAIPSIKDCSIYPGSLTTLADGRIVLHWSCYRSEGERRWRVPQFCLSDDDGKTWGKPRELPLTDFTNNSCLRHPILELSADEWVCPLYDRTIVYNVKMNQVKLFGDGRNHGMVPIVRTVKGTIVSGAPQADASVPLGSPRDLVGGLRSTDGGKTWEALHALPHFGVAGYDLTPLSNGWVVLTSIVYGVGEDGEWAFELIASRDDGKSWDTRHPVEVYNPGRRIAGRGWPRTVQINKETLGTLFYDLDARQVGGPGVFFVRTPLTALASSHDRND